MTNEDIVIEKASEAFKVWTFPPLTQEENRSTPSSVDRHDAMGEASEEAAAKSAPLVVEQEILDLKNELQDKLQIIGDLQTRLNTALKEVDASLLQQMVSCIKKIIFQIIKKELVEDKKAFSLMLEASIKELGAQQHCKILLSPADYQTLEAEILDNPLLSFQQDPTLHCGDYKISTPTGDIVAILEQRISQYFGLSSCV